MLLCYYVCDKYCFLWWQVLSYYGHPSPWGPAGLHNASLRSGFVNGNRVWCSRMSDRLQAYSHMLTVATLTLDALFFQAEGNPTLSCTQAATLCTEVQLYAPRLQPCEPRLQPYASRRRSGRTHG